MTSISFDNYYYGKQIKSYIVQYMAIFSGLKVAIGKNDTNSSSNKIEVPISYGSKDRVVAAIKAENTQGNKPIRVPTMSAYVKAIELDPDLRAGIGQERSDTYLPLGAVLPDGAKVIKKYRPIPYRMQMETIFYSSNSDQRFQMLEQVLMLFDPTLQIQTSDEYNDWTKITTVTLDNITNDEEYPSGNARRILTDTLEFSFPIYLTLPFDIRDDYIKQIKLRLSTISSGDSAYDFATDGAREINEDGYETIIDVKDEDIPEK